MATFQWQSIENCRSSIYQKGQTTKRSAMDTGHELSDCNVLLVKILQEIILRNRHYNI